MATHPDVQRTAQQEIDRVVGNDRLPDFADRVSLPYIEAVYHELLRHSPPLPLGIPHALMEDDVYEGHFLPRRDFPCFPDEC
jgi:cytochrome P450